MKHMIICISFLLCSSLSMQTWADDGGLRFNEKLVAKKQQRQIKNKTQAPVITETLHAQGQKK